jgi:hypothetical protein
MILALRKLEFQNNSNLCLSMNALCSSIYSVSLMESGQTPLQSGQNSAISTKYDNFSQIGPNGNLHATETRY